MKLKTYLKQSLLLPAAEAIRLLTVIPVPGACGNADSRIRSTAFYPLIGALLGLTCWGIAKGLAPVSIDLTAFAILTVTIIFTGGLHLDGLADVSDAMFIHGNRKRRLEIMRDSHVGSFGVIALIMNLLFRFVLIQTLLEEGLTSALILAPIFSRFSMVVLMFFGDSARKDSLGQEIIGNIRTLQGAEATLVTLAFGLFLYQVGTALQLLLLLLLLFVTVIVIKIFCQLRVRGVTGDVLGATNELTYAITCLWMIIFN